MSEYQKDVLSMATGIVMARIYRDKEGQPIAAKVFATMPFLRNTEKTFKLAHKWADEYIDTCKKYEVME